MSYTAAATRSISAANGIDYAFREVGNSDVPLILLQHFRGNLDNWDPALVDALAATRRVIAFDNAGVGASKGITPPTVAEMARDALAFIDALDIERADVLGFSLGSFVAQELAMTRPTLVRRLVLASSAPQGAEGMHGWADDVIDAVGQRVPNPKGVLGVFFARTSTSQQAGMEALGRMQSRVDDRDMATTWATRMAQYDAVTAWGVPDNSLLQRLSAITIPVFVANGDSDPMILPRYSHLLAGLLSDARIKIYPDAAHGFLFQHHAEFAADVDEFLS